MLEKLFHLRSYETSLKQEAIAGLTTFLTMAYIIFVNPSILAKAGMDQNSVFVATCLASAIGCFVMGFLANYPIAQAPGMGLNAFFTYTVVIEMHYSWETALGAVFLSGCCFIILSLSKIREWLINSIPMSLRYGIAAGIGLFLAFIGLIHAGVVVKSDATFVKVGDLTSFNTIMSAIGFFIIIALAHRGVKAAVIISITAVTILGVIFGHVELVNPVSMPPSIAPTFMKLDLSSIINLSMITENISHVINISMITIVFSFLFVDLFDTSGTLIAVAQKGNLLTPDGKLPRLNRALLADSIATITGSVLGTSTTTSYVESTAGVSVGGRTGLTAVVVGILFILALFFAPFAGMVKDYATAGALLYVAILMMTSLAHVNWHDLTDTAPVLLAFVLIPLTYSIATGISIGFVSYVIIKVITGRYKELNLSVIVLGLVFLIKIIAGF